jgi:uncharacterized membrane protein
MATTVGDLTRQRKQNLVDAGVARNSLHNPGLKPAGPGFAGYSDDGEYGGTPAVALVQVGIGVAMTAIGVIGMIRRPRLLSGLFLAGGAMMGYLGATKLLSPTDEMTEAETGMSNPAASIGHLEGIKIEDSIKILRPHRELYDLWRDFSNLPNILPNLERVDVIDENRSHWVAKGPLGTTVEWDAEIYIENVGEMISWRSVEGSEVETAGSVHFDAIGPDETRIRIFMKMDPPGGQLGEAFASLFGDNPEDAVHEALEAFKDSIESHG